jgi:hypothetical protein
MLCNLLSAFFSMATQSTLLEGLVISQGKRLGFVVRLRVVEKALVEVKL